MISFSDVGRRISPWRHFCVSILIKLNIEISANIGLYQTYESHNVNKLLLARQFCSIFDSPYHKDFPLLFSKYRCYFEDGLLNFVETQTKHSYVVELQRYCWIFGSNFIVDSSHPPKSEQNTMATCAQQYRS